MQELDANKDGTISWPEFQDVLHHNKSMSALESVGIDPEAIVDTAEDFFFEEGKPVCLTFEAFMNMVLDCRGAQYATVKDVMILGKCLNARTLSMTSRIDAVNVKLEQLLINA